MVRIMSKHQIDDTRWSTSALDNAIERKIQDSNMTDISIKTMIPYCVIRKDADGIVLLDNRRILKKGFTWRFNYKNRNYMKMWEAALETEWKRWVYFERVIH